MKLKEILEKYTEEQQLVEEHKLLAAEDNLVTESKELVHASTLLAKKTQASADLLAKKTQASAQQLAKTTQTSAELLARITLESATELRKCNEISVRLMERLTTALIALGIIQIVISLIAVFISLRLR